MKRKENYIPFFLVFFGLTLIIILIGKIGIINTVSSKVNSVSSPIRENTVSILSLNSFKDKKLKAIQQQNEKLRSDLRDRNSLVLENKALKDQFAISSVQTQKLLPAKVVGSPGFIPGTTFPQYLIINKGKRDGVRNGSAVIVGEYLVGKINRILDNTSRVELINNKNSVLTGKIKPDDGAEIIGIIKGQGEDNLIFDNVLLTVDLKKDTLIFTKGDIDQNGNGIPPDLVVGRIVSVDKKASDLFQRAAVKSFVDPRNIDVVFVSLWFI